MLFADRITRCPRPYDADHGASAVAYLSGLDPAVHRLIVGMAGCSPYLAGLVAKEADWLQGAIVDPELAVAGLFAALPDVGLDQLPVHLRAAKRRIALITALADLGGVWPLEQVTQVLTDFADAAVQACVTRLVAAEVKRGKLPAGADPDAACGMVVLAMGKMGGGELNYSSDIDLICLFDETRYAPDDYHDVRTAFIRVTRRMAAILSDVKDGGYVLRTDLRLRPDASVMPVCLSMAAAERYYESVGRTWERAAYIKARVCAGDMAAGARFLKTLRPFVWRKHLDFAAIEDAHDMRLKIRHHKGLNGALALEGHNIKLGLGGIREIEFFTQTRQLIAGGRDPSLRVRSTGAGLNRLAAAGWIDDETATALYDHYRFHREVEHRLQMMNDAQTHDLPSDDAGFERLAALMGVATDDLRTTLHRRILAVNGLVDGFFAPDPVAPVQSEWGQQVTARWRTYPALRSARANQIFSRVAPEILLRLQEAVKPEEALAQFDGFLAGLPAGVQLFSLFEANPQLTQLIVDIAATAPALAQYLSRNAGVLDAVIGGSFFDPWPGVDGLGQALTRHLDSAADYETRLIAARRWAKEWHFRIGVHHLRGLIDASESGQQYTDLAAAVLAALWPVVESEFARKHGVIAGQGAVVLGMGSLGAARLHAQSDLDLIMIYHASVGATSDGRRPLVAGAYYARLTQALVTALSAPMAEGRLYEADMRLRPSGRQGPVATSLGAFEDYQMKEAWTWEHLALTQARPITGAPQLCRAVDALRCQVLAAKAGGATITKDVADMRARLAAAKPRQDVYDVKNGSGYFQDIALFAQMMTLRAGRPDRGLHAQLQAGFETAQIDAQDLSTLRDAATLFWQMQAAGQLLTTGPVDAQSLGEGGRRVVLRETRHTDMDRLADDLTDTAGHVAGIISRFLEKN